MLSDRLKERFAFQAQVLIYLILGSLLASSLASAENLYASDSSLDYSWTPASGPVDHYNIYVSVNGGNFVLVDITEDATPVYTLEDAVDGSIYRVKVQAVDAKGNTGPESDPSDPVTVDLAPWDVNNDGIVNLFDIVIVGQNFGQQPPQDTRADVNKDGKVDVFDLVLIGSHFGESTIATP